MGGTYAHTSSRIHLSNVASHMLSCLQNTPSIVTLHQKCNSFKRPSNTWSIQGSKKILSKHTEFQQTKQTIKKDVSWNDTLYWPCKPGIFTKLFFWTTIRDLFHAIHMTTRHTPHLVGLICIPVPPSPTMTSLKLGQLSGVCCPGKAFTPQHNNFNPPSTYALVCSSNTKDAPISETTQCYPPRTRKTGPEWQGKCSAHTAARQARHTSARKQCHNSKGNRVKPL